MKYILALLLSINIAFSNEITVGYLYGAHFPENILNNSHPFVDFGNVMVFQNSFDKISVAPYYKFGTEDWFLSVGVTSGYDGVLTYHGNTFEQTTFLGLLPFIVPSIEHKVAKNTKIILAIVGNSANIGIGIKF